MIEETEERIGKRKLKAILPDCHMTGYYGRCVFLKYSIFNYFRKEDFYYGCIGDGVLYFRTEKEEIALFLDAKFPNSKVKLD